MRRIALFLIAAACMALSAQAQTSVTLAWDYPAPEVITVPASGTTPATTVTNYPKEFVLYATSNATTPLAQWTVIATIPATTTNAGVISVVKQYAVTAQPAGNRFFYLTARNDGGESDPSNVALRSGPPKAGQNLTASKGN